MTPRWLSALQVAADSWRRPTRIHSASTKRSRESDVHWTNNDAGTAVETKKEDAQAHFYRALSRLLRNLSGPCHGRSQSAAWNGGEHQNRYFRPMRPPFF